MSDPLLTLYGKEGCHLCEEAAAMLHSLGITFRRVDIGADGTLRERYGLRIPVLAVGGLELDWPFGPADVRAALER